MIFSDNKLTFKLSRSLINYFTIEKSLKDLVL